MKTTLVLAIILLSSICSAQTEKDLRDYFSYVNFDHFNRDSIQLNMNGRSIVMLGIVGDSVFACYATAREVEMIELYSRYHYKNEEGEAFYFIEDVMASWIRISKKITVAKCYIGNIKNIELTVKDYAYEVLLAEHTRKKETSLYEIITY